MNAANETVKAFSTPQANLGVSKELLSYCRPSVEKYIFTRLYDRLFAMYMARHEEEDERFVAKRSALKPLRGADMMRKLEVSSA